MHIFIILKFCVLTAVSTKVFWHVMVCRFLKNVGTSIQKYMTSHSKLLQSQFLITSFLVQYMNAFLLFYS
jgi:hypothetical protein